jgi:hypothetical protein
VITFMPALPSGKQLPIAGKQDDAWYSGPVWTLARQLPYRCWDSNVFHVFKNTFSWL